MSFNIRHWRRVLRSSRRRNDRASLIARLTGANRWRQEDELGAFRGLEPLEPRMLLTATNALLISEFSATSDNSILDEDDEANDWVELYNHTGSAVDISGWYLTDNAAELTKWQFPAGTIVDPGEFLIVFASNKNRAVTGQELHTNFRLSADGEYLGLIQGDGSTVAFEYAPTYPAQFDNLSYGLSQGTVVTNLIPSGAPVKAFVPSDNSLGTNWTQVGFDDNGWLSGTSGVGYDTGSNYDSRIGLDIQGAMLGVNPSAYVRLPFEVDDPNAFDTLAMTLNYDDAVVGYLNGTEIFRRNAPAGQTYNSAALGEHGGTLETLTYNNFSSLAGWSLRGSAAQALTNRIRLTPATTTQAGAAWTSSTITFSNEYTFSARFSFEMSSPGGSSDGDGPGADGMLFVLQENGPLVLGGAGGAMGLDGAGATFFAVEFDTWASGSWDTGSFPTHIGVISSIQGSIAATNDGVPRFNTGGIYNVWVDYDGLTDRIDVYLTTSATKPAIPTLSAIVDLGQIFDGTTELTAGFTAGTGAAVNNHDVLNFHLQSGAGELGLVSEVINLNQYKHLLQAGDNVLALHGMNLNAGDGDFFLNATLTGIEGLPIQIDTPRYFDPPTPGEFNGVGTAAPAGIVTYSHTTNTFSSAFNLTLSTPSPTATIRYTTDGSIPTATSTVYTGPLNITTTTRIRARAFEPGLSPGPTTSHAFLRISAGESAFVSNLPIMVITSWGVSEGLFSNATTMRPVSLVTIDTGGDGLAHLLGDPVDFGGRGGIRLRGESSLGFAKKQYSLELWEESVQDVGTPIAGQSEDRNASLLGLPADGDWVLYAPWTDKSLMQNYLAYKWFGDMGHYSVRTRFFELWLDDDGDGQVTTTDRQGIYMLTEKIKIDQNRVDIAELTPDDVASPDITGGYIWRKDKPDPVQQQWTTSRGQLFTMQDPEGAALTAAQFSYLQGYVNQFEAALYGPNFQDPNTGYRAFIDVDSWIDTWILVEMTKNIDGFRLSTYYYKDRNGKIVQGPAWDYNLSMGNANYLQGAYPNGWYSSQLSDADYPYWRRLFQDPYFQSKLADRWNELRQTIFSTDAILGDIQATYDYLTMPVNGQSAVQRNTNRWGAGYLSSYQWPNPFYGQGDQPASPLPGGGSPVTYDDQIFIIRWFMTNRTAWMDTQFVPTPQFSQYGGLVPDGYQLTMGADSYPIYQDTTIFTGTEQVRSLVPTSGALGLTWTQVAFNDSTWTAGPGGVGYETATGYGPYLGTLIPSGTTSVYIRKTFNLASTDIERLVLRMRYDDGFVAYLNGVEVARANAPASPQYNSVATGLHDDAAAIIYVEFDITSAIGSLNVGNNVLAVHGLNEQAASSDFLIQFELAKREEVGQTSSLPIYYTLDGSDPFVPPTTQTITLLDERAPASAIVPANNDLGLTWTGVSFDDSGWIQGTGAVGFDTIPVYTPLIGIDLLTTMRNINRTAYTRWEFNIAGPVGDYDSLKLLMRYDDGFIAYLNGTEIARRNSPVSATWNSGATASHPDSLAVLFEEIDITSMAGLLQTGQNVVAIHAMNTTVSDSDFLIEPKLVGVNTFGGVSDTAILYTGPVTIDTTTEVRARAVRTVGGVDEWSGLSRAVFTTTSLIPVGITEINYHPVNPTAAELAIDPLLTEDDFEFVELRNLGGAPLNLVGSNFNLGITYTFGQLMLDPGEYVVLAKNPAALGLRYDLTGVTVVGGYSGSLSNAGETLRLVDSAGRTLIEFTYDDAGQWPGRADGDGSSLEVIDPSGDLNNPSNYRSSSEYGGSPGFTGVGPRSDVVVNEVLAHTDLPALDAVELHNTTGDDIDISGWWLSDSVGNPFKYQIPNGTVIPAGGYIVFDESDFNPTPETPAPNHFAFDAARGERVVLIETVGGLPASWVQSVDFGAQANGESWGRWPDAGGELYPMTSYTPNAANSGPRVGPVIISEVNYNPGNPGGGFTSNQMEFIEIYNSTDTAVDLTNWTIAGGVNYNFAPGQTLDAYGVLVIVSFDPANPADDAVEAAFRAFYGIDGSVELVGPYTGVLDNGGESVRLHRPDSPPIGEPGFYPQLLEDKVDYDDDSPWPATPDGLGDSLNRTADDAWGLDVASWEALAPTPGAVTLTPPLGIPGDFNGDTLVNAEDIDLLFAEINAGTHTALFDLTGDDLVTSADADHWVHVIMGTQYGDANLDKKVNITDLSIVAVNFGAALSGWAQGNFNGQAGTNIADLSAVAVHFGFDNSGGGGGAAAGATSGDADVLAEAKPKVIAAPSLTQSSSQKTTPTWSHIVDILNA